MQQGPWALFKGAFPRFLKVLISGGLTATVYEYVERLVDVAGHQKFSVKSKEDVNYCVLIDIYLLYIIPPHTTPIYFHSIYTGNNISPLLCFTPLNDFANIPPLKLG